MKTSQAWFTIIALTIILLVLLAVAGLVSEVVAPEVQTQIGEAWSQAPR